MILVMGATGHVGSKVVTHLLENAQQVRCVARKFPNKTLFAGAELAPGDANNVSFLADAMRGCNVVLTMIPSDVRTPDPRYYQNKMGEVIAEAIEEACIKKVVNLSSVGADLEAQTGPVLGLHDQEERLNAVTRAEIIHLRPTYYMENLLQGIPAIIKTNNFFGTIPADKPVSMVATIDVAARAAHWLMNPSFHGRSVEYILGERDVTFAEVVRVVAETIKKPELDYLEVPHEEMRRLLTESGMSEGWAKAFNDLNESIANGVFAGTIQRSQINTSSTSLEDFVRTEFVSAYMEATKSLGIRPKNSRSSENQARP
ncbi:MAG: NAD(P)H-binding protein [Bdellovibrio sp.]|nr:NAD(P)H-binding protein [Bdellovibrio sp.]